ncbi:MAG: IS21-like element helper ATPase IstB [Planctomycetota bacterium]
MSGTNQSPASLGILLKALRLPTIATQYDDVAAKAVADGWTHQNYLGYLLELEIEDRRVRRVSRHLKKSKLPSGKTLATLDLKCLPTKVAQALPSLCDGGFVGRAENILAFGNPGTGKSHIACAIGHELVNKGFAVLFVPAFCLVQHLLVAKRDLCLDTVMRRLDRFDVVILDDIGYVQQDRAEMEVLFTFLSERYERRSVMITSNLVFSQWDKIFKDAMTTAAAIDRVVHHSTILELTGKSFRTEAAKKRGRKKKMDD